MLYFWCLTAIILCTLNYVEGVRILAAYPVPGKSRQNFYRSITQELLSRGHELVVITADPDYPKGHGPKNLTEIDVHDISYKIWRDTFLNTPRGGELDAIVPVKVGFAALSKIFEKQIRSPKVKRLLEDKANKFDLILVESVIVEPLALSHFFKVPLVQFSSMTSVNGNFECIGGSSHPILYPSTVKRRISYLTICQKLEELYNYFTVDNFIHQLVDKASLMTKSLYGDDFPHYKELRNNVHLMLLNMHPIVDLNRPVPPSVNYISGVYQAPVKELPEDLKKKLDSSKNGVIYVSFGTNTIPSSLKSDFIKTMLKVFSELPYDILFKWDLEKLPEKPNNVKIFKWLPQPDILRHPNTKLFITQGGVQSTDEAISAGVPLIGIPMMTDQWLSTENYVKHKFGLKLQADTITEESLKTAITTILGDESYRHNLIKFRTLVYDQPQQPMDRAMWWIDHVIRHSGASHLRDPAANVTWTQYFELELIAICLTAVTIVVSAIVLVLRKFILLF